MKFSAPILFRLVAAVALLGFGARLLAADANEKAQEYAPVGFDKLASFNFVPPDTDTGVFAAALADAQKKADEASAVAAKLAASVAAASTEASRLTNKAVSARQAAAAAKAALVVAQSKSDEANALVAKIAVGPAMSNNANGDMKGQLVSAQNDADVAKATLVEAQRKTDEVSAVAVQADTDLALANKYGSELEAQLANAQKDAETAKKALVAAATSAKSNEQIPDRIKAYDQQKVAVTGFMLPVKMDGGLVKEFLLVKDPMLCCYGVMPKVTEWVVVKMTGPGVKPLMDTPITFLGKLRVGEIMENGYLTGIYLLEGEKQG